MSPVSAENLFKTRPTCKKNYTANRHRASIQYFNRTHMKYSYITSALHKLVITLGTNHYLPNGLVSKNNIGARRTDLNILLCKF